MKYWKIGSRWHAKGAKSNSILDVFLQNSIVFVKEVNTGGRMMNDVKIGDIIAITDGVDIVATAKVKSSPSYLRNYTLNLPPHISSFFGYHENENDTVAVKVDLVRTNIKIPYRQGAFCEILDSALQSQLP